MKIPRALCLLMICALIMIHYPAMGAEKPLTLMIYMTGSNLESEYLAASMDIQEMISSRFQRDYLNLVIMTGGAEKWHSQGIPADELTIYHLERVNLVKDASFPLSSMGRDEVLSTFLQYGYDHFPAEKYALILWNHGSGPVNGVCMDEIFQGDMLLPSELARAMENSPFQGENRLEWVGFDACLMANVETAHLMAPHARYMIASQETEPGNGWDYSFLSRIHEDANGAETGKRIIDLYYESAMKKTPGNPITLSLVDLARMEDVRTGLDSLFGELAGRISSYNFSEFAIQRRDAAGVGRAVSNDSEYDLVDLMGLVKNHQEDREISDHPLAQAIETAVLYQKTNQPNLTGLSIYHPYYNKFAYQNRWKQEYEKIAASEAYLDYLNSYIRIWMGEEMTNWQNLQPMLHVAEDQSGQTISLQLTPDQLKNFASAEFAVLSVSNSWGYRQLYRQSMGLPDENGLLQLNYAGRQLVNCDAEGNITDSDFNFLLKDDIIILIGTLTNQSILDDDAKLVRIFFQMPEEGEYLEFLYMEELIDGAYTARHQIELNNWKYFYVSMLSRDPTYDETGELLPYENWAFSDSYSAYGINLQQGLRLKFSDRQISNDVTRGIIYIYDVQGNLHVTPLFSMQHLSSMEIDPEETVMIDRPDFRMTLTGAELVSSLHSPAIRLHVRIENKSLQTLSISMRYAAVDNAIIRSGIGQLEIDIKYPGVPAGESLDTVIHISLDEVLKMGKTDIRQMIFYYSVNDEYNEIFVTDPVSVSADLARVFDLSSPPILASSETNGLKMEILELFVDDEQLLNARFRITNTTEKDMNLKLRNAKACINQYRLTAYSDDLFLPAGHFTVEQITFENRYEAGFLTMDAEAFFDDLMSAWQIRQVESLQAEWLWEIGSWLNEDYQEMIFPFSFRFHSAYPYWQNRQMPMGSAMELIPFFEDDQLSLKLAGLTIEDQSLYLILECRNQGHQNLNLEWISEEINGFPAQFSGLFNQYTLPAHTTVLHDFEISPDAFPVSLPGELNQIGFSCSVSPENEENASITLIDASFGVAQPAVKDVFFYGDQLTLLSSDFEAKHAVPFIDSHVDMPDDAGQYQMMLTFIPESPVKNVRAHFFIPHNEYYVPVIGVFHPEEQPDGTWQIPFHGLYATVSGQEDKILLTAFKEQWDDTQIWYAGSMEAYASSLNRDYVIFPDPLLEINFRENQAKLIFPEEMPATLFGYDFKQISCYMSAYYPLRDEQGRVKHFSDWITAEKHIHPEGGGYYFCVANFTNTGLPLQFSLLPLSQYPGEMYLLYSYELEDGSRHSSGFIPIRDLYLP